MFFETIVQTINEILAERGDALSVLEPETRIENTKLDSLDIAALVARLSTKFGVDPFANPDLEVYPQTLDELAKLYDQSHGAGEEHG